MLKKIVLEMMNSCSILYKYLDSNVRFSQILDITVLIWRFTLNLQFAEA